MLVEPVRAREIHEGGPVGFHHRDAEQFTELDQAFDGAGIAADMFGDGNRILGVGDQAQGFLDRRAIDMGRPHDFVGPVLLRQVDLFHHAFEGNADQHGAGRRFDGNARGALDGRRQEFGGHHPIGPFHATAQQVRRAAEIGQVVQPLAAGIGDFGVLAVGGNLAADDHHRRALLQRRAQSHRGIERAGGGVQHDHLRSAGDFGVTRGHGHRDGFMAAVNVAWFLDALAGLLRERFPDRRPLGAGGRKYIIDSSALDRLQHRLSAVHRESPL